MLKLALLIFASVTLAATAPAQVVPQRSLIAAPQVIDALRMRNIPTDGVNIQLPAQITASLPNAALQIQTVTLTSSHEARLRLTCVDHKACLPFIAQAIWPSNSAAITLPPDLQPHKTSPESIVKSQVALAVGMPATLEMEQGHIHIRLQVTSLQQGAIGDRIRVTTRDHKQTYTAEVISPTLLKGSL